MGRTISKPAPRGKAAKVRKQTEKPRIDIRDTEVQLWAWLWGL